MKFFQSTFPLAAGLLSAVLPLAYGAGMPRLLPWGRNSKITIPFRSVHDEMVVSLSLNGHKGMNFLIDTGFGVTVLDASAAASAHVKTVPVKSQPLKSFSIQSLAGTFSPTQAAPRASIVGYGLELRDNFLVDDLEPLQKRLGVPLAGIIGFNFLGQFPFLVDYSAKTITVFPSMGKNDPLRQGIEVPMEAPIPGEGYGPVVCLYLELPDGRRVKANLTVDTGSAEGLILNAPFVERYGLQPEDKAQTLSETTYGGVYDLLPGRVPALLLGNLRVADFEVLYAERPVGMAGNKLIDGEIGYKILSRFRIFMDGPHHRVLFEPVAQTLPLD